MLRQSAIEFSLFYWDFCAFHWHDIQNSLMNRYGLSLDETTILIRSTLEAIYYRWDELSEEPLSAFWVILRRKQLAWCGDHIHAERYHRPPDRMMPYQEPVNTYPACVA